MFMRYRLQIGYATFTCLVIGWYFAMPEFGVWAFAVAGSASLAAVSATALWWKPARRPAWVFLAVGICVLAVGEVVYHVLASDSRQMDFGDLPGVVYLAAYLPFAISVLWLGLGRAPSRDMAAIIEIAALSLAGSLVVWISLVKPLILGLGLTGVDKIVAVACGVSTVVIFVGVAQLLRMWRRNLAAVVLSVAFLALTIESAVYAIRIKHGTWHAGTPIEAAALVFFALSGAAALTPSMVRLGSTPAVRHRLGVGGLFALAAALLAAPTALLVEATSGPVQTPDAIAVVSGVVGLLIIVLLADAVRGRRRALQREGDIRRSFRQLGAATTRDDVASSLASAFAAMADGPTAVDFDDIADAASGIDPTTHLRLPLRAGLTASGDVVERHDSREVVFTAAGSDLVELEDILTGLTEQAEIALQRIDLAARMRDSEKEQAALEYRVTHDGLTGLANAELLRAEILVAASSTKHPGATALLFVDLDDFKSINDTLGHEAGDQVLVRSAQRIRAHLRDEDLAARMGGDEFAVLLYDVAASHANDVAERLTKALARPVMVSGIAIVCRASVGLAMATSPEDHDTLLHRADTALYAAKAGGKGRWRFHDPVGTGYVRRGHDLHADLDRLVCGDDAGRSRDGGLTVNYQPIVELTNRTARGFEALIGWQHPTQGTIPAPEIIDIAESTGLIMPLGDWMLHQVLTDVIHLGADGPSPRYVSVNVATAQLLQPGLAERVRRHLDRAGVDPRCLVLEITESRLMRDDERIWEEFSHLHDLGVRVAIDDFGTGYGSLGYLRRPRIDMVKLDPAFLGNIFDRRNQTIVRSVIALAHRLGVDLVADGIEDRMTCAALADLGCRLGQGDLFAAAMPPTQAHRWAAGPGAP